MAIAMGESETAEHYQMIFKKGKAWVDQNLFNGEYYCQKLDINNKDILAPFSADHNIYKSYWNDESLEIKYQIGEGCMIDQVIAQWHANLCGLGEIFDPEHTRQALQSIYKYNFKPNFQDFAHIRH